MIEVTVFGTVLLLLTALSSADLNGIWTDEKTDLAFRFRTEKGAVTGVMFGDEFDLPVQDLQLDGDQISFTVIRTDYYTGRKTKAIFTGTLTQKGLELTRDQPNPDPAKATKTSLTLKKVTAAQTQSNYLR